MKNTCNRAFLCIKSAKKKDEQPEMTTIYTPQNPKAILQTCVYACNQSTIIKKKKKKERVKYEMEHYRLEWQSARDCAGPLSHCLLLPEKEKRGRERGKKRGEEMVNREKQVRPIEISLFFIIYY